MDLLLVRCGDMAEGGSDLPPSEAEGVAARDAVGQRLSERGEKQARRLAAWLRQQAPRELQIFSSPAKAARQMSGLISAELGGEAAPPVVSRLLGPTAVASDLLGAVGWPNDHRAALVVAHQPALGHLAALLIAGQEAPLPFKRGALWWFSSRHRDGELQTVLRCVLPPDLLRGPGRSKRHEAVDPPLGIQIDVPDVGKLLRRRLGGKSA